MPSYFKSVSEVINKDKSFSKFRKGVSEVNVIEEFSNIFPELSKTVKASNINKGILYLVVENSVLRNEIYLKKQLMIDKINKHFNRDIINSVKFTNFRTIHRK